MIRAHIVPFGDLPEAFPRQSDEWFNWVFPSGLNTVERVSIVHDADEALVIARLLAGLGVSVRVYFTPKGSEKPESLQTNGSKSVASKIVAAAREDETLARQLKLVSLKSFTELLDDFSAPDPIVWDCWSAEFSASADSSGRSLRQLFDSIPAEFLKNFRDCYWAEFESWLSRQPAMDQASWFELRQLFNQEFVLMSDGMGGHQMVHHSCPAIRYVWREDHYSPAGVLSLLTEDKLSSCGPRFGARKTPIFVQETESGWSLVDLILGPVAGDAPPEPVFVLRGSRGLRSRSESTEEPLKVNVTELVHLDPTEEGRAENRWRVTLKLSRPFRYEEGKPPVVKEPDVLMMLDGKSIPLQRLSIENDLIHLVLDWPENQDPELVFKPPAEGDDGETIARVHVSELPRPRLVFELTSREDNE